MRSIPARAVWLGLGAWLWLAGVPAAHAQTATGTQRSLFGGLLHDFGAVFTSADNLRTAGIGLAGSAAALLLDDEIADSGFSTELREGGFLDRFFEPGDLMGSAYVQVGAPVAMYGMARLMKKPEAAELGRDLLRAQIVTQALTQAVKFSVRRTRPDGGSNAFPSGHTSATFAAAAVVHQRYGWKAGGVAFAVATWVGASRLNEQRHWMSDLPLGAAIGVLVGRTLGRRPSDPPPTSGDDSDPARQPRVAGRRSRPGSFVVMPVAVPGGAALVVTRMP